MNFDPYVAKNEQNVDAESQEEATPVESEAEVPSAPVVVAPAEETMVTAAPVEPAESNAGASEYEVQPLEEAAIVEDSQGFGGEALAEYYIGSYPATEKESYTETIANEEYAPEAEEAPAIEVKEENVLGKGPEGPQTVENKFAKEKEQMEYEVIIGKNTSFKGEINIDGATRIDGRVEGTVCVNNDLFVGETGHIEGEIKVINATISGTLVGNIKCSSRLELLSTSSISGDIQCGALIVAEGASINATVACGKAVAKNEPAPAAEPAAE